MYCSMAAQGETWDSEQCVEQFALFEVSLATYVKNNNNKVKALHHLVSLAQTPLPFNRCISPDGCH